MNLNEFTPEIKLDQQYFIPLASGYAKLSDVLDSLDMPQELSVVGDTLFFDFKDSIVQSLPTVNLLKNFKRSSVSVKPFTNLPNGVTLTIPKDSVIPSQSFIVNVPFVIDTAFNDQQIDSIYFRSARIALQINASQVYNLLPSNTRIKIKFLKNLVFSNGTKEIYHYPKTFGSDEYVQLDNFYLDCRDKSNTISFEITFEFLQNRKQRIYVNNSSSVSMAMELQEPVFKAVYGIFNFSNFNGLKIKEIPFEKYLPGMILKFADAKINLTTVTNAGVNLMFNIDEFALSSGNSTNSQTNYADFNGSRRMSTQLRKPAYLYESVVTHLKEINNSYGRLDQVFNSNYPLTGLRLKYSFTKPLSNLIYPEFLTEDTYFKLIYSFKTPMHLNEGSKLSFSSYFDSIQPTLNKILKTDTIQKIGFVFDFKNEFPADLILNLQYLDTLGVSHNLALTKDPAFKNIHIVEAPPVNEKGIVIKDSIKVQRLFLEFNKVNFETLKLVDRINLNFTIQTGVNKPMFFTTKDKVSLKLGVYTKGDFLIEF